MVEHLESARTHGCRPVLGDQLVADVAEEIGLSDLCVQAARFQLQIPLRDGLRVLGARNVEVREHRAQHLVPPRERLVRRVERVEVRRRLRQPGEQRRLGERELRGRLREVRLRRRFDPVGVVSVVDLVLVGVQDLGLRPAVAELDREARLLGLALDRPLP
jgi:hypothetical protein